MNSTQQQIKSLLGPLAAKVPDALQPASPAQLEVFQKRAGQAGVEAAVIDQLSSLYNVANGFEAESILAFHSCDDEILFEWWREGELWLGQKDFYTLRWSEGKFCLGDAANRSFSPAHESDTLPRLIHCCIREMEAAG